METETPISNIAPVQSQRDAAKPDAEQRQTWQNGLKFADPT